MVKNGDEIYTITIFLLGITLLFFTSTRILGTFMLGFLIGDIKNARRF